jgi:hypothetical protein
MIRPYTLAGIPFFPGGLPCSQLTFTPVVPRLSLLGRPATPRQGSDVPPEPIAAPDEWVSTKRRSMFHLVGGAITCNNHLEKYEFVNGKDDIPYMKGQIKKCLKPPTRLSNHQVRVDTPPADWGSSTSHHHAPVHQCSSTDEPLILVYNLFC